MFIHQLGLKNFRNYVRLGLQLEAGVTVLVGENAQGKSNLLEAIHVLATTRSLRASAERELVSWRAAASGEPFARLEARVARQDGGLHVEILLRPDPGSAPDGSRSDDANASLNGSTSAFGKTIKVNGLPSRAAQLVGKINVVLFSPEDVALASGSPSGRRRYLDITNSQVNPLYLRSLQRYNRLLVQRNHLLRQIRERRQPARQLEPWNVEQATLGSAILAQRLKMVTAVNQVIGERFRELSGLSHQLDVDYNPTSLPAERSDGVKVGGPVSPASATDLAEAFRQRLEQVAGREIEQAVSLVGPHRDDFAFRLDGMDVTTFGSRGQQRLAVLALKLAEAEFMQAETDERPILLLDDVLSELDPVRRALVLERCTSFAGQTLVTTTSQDDLSPEFVAQARLLRVDAGTIAPIPAEPGTSSPRASG